MITTINEFKKYLNESVSFNDNIKFENLHINSHHDQHDYRLNAKLNDELVGYVEYAVFKDEVFISMIESLVSGKSVGPTMMKWLADKYGYENIERTQLTPDGMKLRKKMDDYYDFDYNKHKESQNKHIDVSIIEKIRNKHPLIASFMSDMVLYGNDKTWTKWIDKIRSGVFNIPNNLDINDIADITEWIKNSDTNNNDSDTEVPEPILKDLEKLL